MKVFYVGSEDFYFYLLEMNFVYCIGYKFLEISLCFFVFSFDIFFSVISGSDNFV